MIRFVWLAVLLTASACGDAAQAPETSDTADSTQVEATASMNAEAEPSIDYLSFANGAIPVAIGGDAELLRVTMEQALRTIDGDEQGFSATPKPGLDQSTLSFTYRLPAATRFTRFGVPNILETPSPSQTFFREVQVFGNDLGPGGEFALLGAASLATHDAPGQQTYFAADQEKPVTWVKVQLSGGINVERDQTFFEFSELIGEGRQEPVDLSMAFNGSWRGRGVLLELKQEGSNVLGCYDRVGDLQGAVSGNILRATGTNRSSGVESAFVLSVVDGDIIGVRSTNGAPFKLYAGETDPDLVTECASAKVQPPSCGDTFYGIQFDYDSSLIRPDSLKAVDLLLSGLREASATTITIVGHTSNEGSDAYNLDLSKRRAEAVVAALQERGLDSESIAARGAGEAEPIADNRSEAGRSLNRRVTIECI